MNKTVYIALGSNIENREQNLKLALEEIKEFAHITKESKIHETKPWGYKDQDDFLNMAIAIETDLEAINLLARLQEIEHKMGRTREIKNGPRTIDLDILLYGNEIIERKLLKIPHPEMHKRKFVLKPLLEIAESLEHPILKKTIKQLHESL